MMWTDEAVADLLVQLRDRGRGTADVAVRAAQDGTPRLEPTLSAFGNMPDGGTIILGVAEDAEFSVLGVDDPAGLAAAVAEQARDGVDPAVHLLWQEVVVEGRTVLVMSVLPSPTGAGPHLYRHQAYLRHDDGDYRMSRPEIEQFMARHERPRHDGLPVADAGPQHLDPTLVEQYVRNWRHSSTRMASLDDTEILTRTRVLSPDGRHPTVAGLYALGAWPQEFLPRLSLTAVVEPDPRSGQGTPDVVDLNGPLPLLLADAVDWVHRVTGGAVPFTEGGDGPRVSSLPLGAVRELLANALVHRDLSPHTTGTRVELRLRPSDVLITSPGGLWGVTTDQLGAPGGTSPVNEFLYDIAKYVRLPDGSPVIDGEGGGIQEAQRLLRAASLRPAHFIDGAIRFTCLMPRHALISTDDWQWLTTLDPHGALNRVQRQVLASMRHGQVWTDSRLLEEYAPIDAVDARAVLQGLVAMGLAVTDGAPDAAAYRLSPTLVAPEAPAPAPVTPVASPALPPTGPAPPPTGRSRTRRRSAPLHMRIAQLLEGGPLPMSDIAEELEAPTSSVRSALSTLRRDGRVVMVGGQGHRDTRYGLPDS